MRSERRYYDDSYTTKFSGDIIDVGVYRGAPAVELSTTWFYPESGGQLGDHGRIAGASVVDVQADQDERVWHVVDTVPSGRALACEVDWARRFDHMQQHTGQHILSAAFERLKNAATLSSTLGAERSVIEVALDDVDWRTVQTIEEAANRVLWDDRALVLHWTDAEGVKKFPLRKPPKVTGRIRVVEVPDVSRELCGGTHAWRTEQLLDAAKRRSSGERELIAHLERALEEREELRKQLTALTRRLVADEARAAVGSPPKSVSVLAPDRSREDARAFALACLEAGAPWVVSGTTAPEPSLVVARQKANTALDLKALAPELLAAARGKGGGSPEMVTVAPADAAGAEAAYQLAVERLTAP